jgi:GMP synthase (glutamine-hydrolysing)
MNIHYFQHVPYEGPANLEAWARKSGHATTITRLFRGEDFPDPSTVDWLIVLGGPMSVHDEARYPWLSREKQYIQRVLKQEIPVLGVCLGAQLLAESLGGAVRRGAQREIGWFPVHWTESASLSTAWCGLPDPFVPFHWHAETLVPPPDSIVLARSGACPVQAFEWRGRAWGLQFHLESTAQSVDLLIRNCSDDRIPGPYVQKDKELRQPESRFEELQQLLFQVMDRLEKKN